MAGGFTGVAVGAVAAVGFSVGDGDRVGVGAVLSVGASGACVGLEQPVKATRMTKAAVTMTFCTVGASFTENPRASGVIPCPGP